MSGYLKHRTKYVVAAATTTVITLIAIVFIIRHQKKLDESQERLRQLNAEISEQNLWFDAAVANMSNGLSVFNADGRLMVWNDRFVEIYGMPPELICRGVSITDIVDGRQATGILEPDVEAYIGEFRGR